MGQEKIGIGDIGLYVPDPRMDMSTLMEARSETHPELERILSRAIEKTGQTSFRFPEPWEDTSSLAANAAARALDRLPAGDAAKLRYLTVGTETSVDHSKPVASYVQGMLQRAGYSIGNSLSTFEVKHACAGGTAALLSSAALLSFSGTNEERALAISSDIARYEAPSTAEITQGAGAAAVLIEKNPRLLEMDLSRVGFFSSDVDDFYRPLGSVTARVKGRYSMECYQEALEAAFADYCHRTGGTPCDVIDSVDYVALHVPFAKMPEVALKRLLKNTCGRSDEQIDTFMKDTGFLEAMYLSSTVGNLYTASIYAYLVALLHQENERVGRGIIGKTVLIASYGSGNTMTVYTAKIAEQACEVISSWDVDRIRRDSRAAGFTEYLNWLARPKDIGAKRNLLEGARPAPDRFYLKDFDDNGLRIYGRG